MFDAVSAGKGLKLTINGPHHFYLKQKEDYQQREHYVRGLMKDLGFHWVDQPGLTEAPAFTTTPSYDNGQVYVAENDVMYYYADYMVKDPWQILAETGEVTLNAA
jgi:hypothetical protein